VYCPHGHASYMQNLHDFHAIYSLDWLMAKPYILY
jgi:hypothetical protein